MCDLILFNANVMTMDPALPRAELIAIRGGTIVQVTQNDRLCSLAEKNTQVIDCRGKTVLPGFIDAHCHVPAYVESLVSLNLSPREHIRSIADIQHRIRDLCNARAPGTWIRGKGYNEFYLAEQRHPNRWDLDIATSLHPIKLTHRSGHAHVLNSFALKCVGITVETGDLPEGLIDRDLETGEPTGILYGMGHYLAQKIPPIDDAEMERGLVLANQKLLSYGITSVQDASAHNDLRQWRWFEEWKAQGIFKPRVTMMGGVKGFEELKGQAYSSWVEENQLRLGGVKMIVDEVTGSLHPSQKELNERVLAIHEKGFQGVIHAVEERTIEASCNAIEYALRNSPRSDHRHRIEHCSICPPSLLHRLRDLGVAVVTQPSFLYYNGDRYLRTVPKSQQAYLYPIGTMQRNGLLVGSSSDFPIADPDPLIGVYSAVTRMTESGEVIFRGEEVGPSEALRMSTLLAAAANFEDGIKGSVSPNKVADLIVLNEDPLGVDANHIKDIQVEMTILGGQVVWSRSVGNGFKPFPTQ
jgi:predicted amidohydrolase YtcJ